MPRKSPAKSARAQTAVAISAAPLLVAGAQLHGFRVTRVTPLPSLRATVFEARHERTGARVLHLASADTENLLAIAFRTPPPDDTGVPHILEHSVLGGSEKYPVKDPFLEMLKRSMATFINAFTYSDKTVYPVSSNCRQDFLNLADVYLDAVFHPLISPMALKQEGHHLALTNPSDPDSPLLIKGIVYNEMKGAYSEVDSLIERSSTQYLFPDTAYGRDSGGDPAAIPTLTYENFAGFFAKLYHPSNAFIFLYGDIPTAEHLAFLDQRLQLLPPAAEIDSALSLQTRWSTPRESVEAFAIGADETTARKAAVTLNWIVGNAADPVTDLALDVVDRLLLGHAGAPLYKALIDSRLGEDLTPCGYSGGTLETTFHIGLKGTDAEHQPAIVALVLRVLADCVRDGFPKERVDAAFQQLEYAQREISANYALRLMNRVYDAWIYDLDPLHHLRLGEYLEELYRRWQAEPGLFCRLIQERLLDNPHRLTARFEPDPQLQARKDAEFAAAMAARKAALGPDSLRQLREEAAELERRQSLPNTPEALATLPTLHLSDLPPKPRPIPGELLTLAGGVPLLRNDVFANGVNYFVLAIDLSGLPAELWPFLPVFADVFTHVGAAKLSYVEMAERIAARTGGLSADLFVTCDAVDPDRILPFLSVSLKALDRTLGDALSIVRDLLLELDLTDTERLRDLMLQAKAQRQSGIIQGGHRFAAMHAARGHSLLGRLSCLIDGLPQVRLSRRLARDFDTEVEELRGRLEQIRRFLLNPARLRASFTGSNGLCDTAAQWLEGLGRTLPTAPFPAGPAILLPDTGPVATPEGLAMASEVAFCACVLPAPPAMAPEAPAVSTFSQLLSLGYLWEEIRAKGGAYGGFCTYDPGVRVFSMMSYRDPNIVRTLEVFARAKDEIGRMDFSAAKIENAIISMAKGEERPIRPGPATGTALWRYLTRLSEDLRQTRYQALLGVDGPRVQQTAQELFDRGAGQATICALAGRQLLDAAAAKLPQPLAIENILDEGDAAGDDDADGDDAE